MNRVFISSIVVLAAVFAVSCGSDDDSSNSNTAKPVDPELTRACKAYCAAIESLDCEIVVGSDEQSCQKGCDETTVLGSGNGEKPCIAEAADYYEKCSFECSEGGSGFSVVDESCEDELAAFRLCVTGEPPEGGEDEPTELDELVGKFCDAMCDVEYDVCEGALYESRAACDTNCTEWVDAMLASYDESKLCLKEYTDYYNNCAWDCLENQETGAPFAEPDRTACAAEVLALEVCQNK